MGFNPNKSMAPEYNSGASRVRICLENAELALGAPRISALRTASRA